MKRPHGASVAAVIDGVTYVSSVLPWGSSPPGPPFRGVGQAAQTVAALKDLKAWLGAQERLVWGGDWNHSLKRPWRYSGSTAGRERLDALLGELGLHAPTRHLPRGWKYDFPSIDHVAVLDSDATAEHVEANGPAGRLSDHDAYVVETAAR